MKSRLQLLLQNYNLSASKLAELIDVQASGISHILSGRNNPSMDFVVKCLNAFPDINPEWFILGTGAMHKTPGSIESGAGTGGIGRASDSDTAPNSAKAANLPKNAGVSTNSAASADFTSSNTLGNAQQCANYQDETDLFSTQNTCPVLSQNANPHASPAPVGSASASNGTNQAAAAPESIVTGASERAATMARSMAARSASEGFPETRVPMAASNGAARSAGAPNGIADAAPGAEASAANLANAAPMHGGRAGRKISKVMIFYSDHTVESFEYADQ